MKVLIVSSFNAGQISPFISEQVGSLRKSGITFDHFLVKGKGIIGYLANFRAMNEKIDEFNPDLIHAHYGLSGLLSNLQRKVPVITTFHGSDVNLLKVRHYSGMAALLSARNIFISYKLREISYYKGKQSVIPSGTDLNQFFPVNKADAREKIGLPLESKLVLFSGSFNNRIKNHSLAKEAISLLHEAHLIELNGYTRQEVNLLLNACDVALMTSYHEGSPQFIKEAMACNRPIVSTDVGDVRMVIGTTKGCFISKTDKLDIAKKITHAMEFSSTVDGRQRIIDLGLDLETIAGRILEVYNEVLK